MSRADWTVHPARDRPIAAILGTLSVCMTGATVGLTAGHVAAGIAGAVALVAPLRHFFFPTRYRVDERGVSVRCLGVTSRRSWSRLRRFRHDGAGGFLSTRSRPSRLDSFTGLHLTWAGNNDEVVALIERYMAKDEKVEGRDGCTGYPLTPNPSSQGEGDRNRVREGVDG